MSEWKKHVSCEDKSVNFIREAADGGMLEARFVRRTDDYFIIYVSSHTGCRHACRFCHLTQTGQTMFTPATVQELTEQVALVMNYYETSEPKAQRVHINFMARGDALSSDVIWHEFDEFASFASAAARRNGLDIRFNISTIFPLDSADKDLCRAFESWPVFFYWSLYSLEEKFRKRWLPRAQAPEIAAQRLREYQERTGREVVFHWAFIEGQNDQDASVSTVRDWIAASGLEGRFNLVRYNPHNPATGQEPNEARLEELFEKMVPVMRRPGSRIVPRVGFDVAASCGMFLSADHG